MRYVGEAIRPGDEYKLKDDYWLANGYPQYILVKEVSHGTVYCWPKVLGFWTNLSERQQQLYCELFFKEDIVLKKYRLISRAADSFDFYV